VVDFTYDGTRHFYETNAAGTKNLYELEQTNRQTGSIYTYSMSLAAQPTERTLLGVTLNRWEGKWESSSANSEWPLTHEAEKESFTYSQSNSLNGWNFDLGLLLRYPHFSVGLRYRTPFDATYSYSGSLETNMPTPLEPPPYTRTTLHWPGTLNAGLAFRPTDSLLVALDWGRTDWSKMTFQAPGSGEVNFFDLVPADSTMAEKSDDWRAGAEYLFFLGKTIVPLRVGWSREPQPARDPVTGDRVIRTGWSLGTGVKYSWFALDASVRYSTSSTAVSRFLEAGELATGNLRATSTGTLDRHEVSAFLSLLIQIPSGSAPEKILREVFVGPEKKSP
jgi:hypothetical protein